MNLIKIKITILQLDNRKNIFFLQNTIFQSPSLLNYEILELGVKLCTKVIFKFKVITNLNYNKQADVEIGVKLKKRI